MSPVVAFDKVSKLYRLGTGRGSLREALEALPGRLVRRAERNRDGGEWLWALRDVSFDLQAGQVLGVVGRNGAGKTTLLKLLSRVAYPTSGRIEVRGRVSALIELGAGFHPDLTGRENIYLNGAILGLSRKEIDRKFDSIVEFAELAKFIDTPVKRYSSGMYARLGFAVAAHSDPDLLLVDEVLAVGDAAFQRKCYDFIHSFVTGGHTAIFVSHSMYAIEQLCTRLIWLESGRVAMAGDTRPVLTAYLDSVEKRLMAERIDRDGAADVVRMGAVVFTDSSGGERDTFCTGDDIVVRLEYETKGAVERPHFSLAVVGPDGGGPLIRASMLVDDKAPARIEGVGTMTCHFKSVPLAPKVYSVYGEIWGSDRIRVLAKWRRLGAFRITDEIDGTSRENGKGSIWHIRADAPIRVPYEWELEDGATQLAALERTISG